MVWSGFKDWRSSPHFLLERRNPRPSAIIDLRPNFSAGISFQGIQMGGQLVVASVVKDLCIGVGLVLFSECCWRLCDWNDERKVRTLYDGLLEKGEIYQDLLQKGLVGVVAEEQEYKTPVQIMSSDRD